jgi:exopolysaccharide biosynthesis polyprenyl glycosylphosphotransferase
MSNKNILIIGGSFSGRSVAREILSTKSLNLNLVGYVSNKTRNKMKVFDGDEVKENEEKIKSKIDYLGSENDLIEIIKNYNVKYIVIAKDRNMNKELVDILEKAKKICKIYFIDEIYEAISRKLPVLHLSKDYFYFLFRTIEKEKTKFKLYDLLNRTINFLAALIGIIISLPIMLLISIIIKIESKGPIFFKQKRVGKNGKVFTCYKFRSMEEHEEDKHSKYVSKKDPRVTRFGRIMRKLRLDELPQFFNILKGDMNLIGPRAEWIKLVKKYREEIPFYNHRHIVRPGITGWAQVNYPYGRNIQDTIYKLQYDLYYVKNRSFFFDILIFLRTLKIVLCGKGM